MMPSLLFSYCNRELAVTVGYEDVGKEYDDGDDDDYEQIMQ